MSLWYYKKDKSGNKILWQIDIAIPFVMIVLGLLAAITTPNRPGDISFVAWLPFILSSAGLMLLLISKLSLFRRGIWFSFGPKQMTEGYASLYKAAYLLLGIGALLMLALLRAL
jgi:hypothetical protein